MLSLLQGQLSVKQQKILEGAAKHSFHKGLSSMNTQYARLVGADRLVGRSSKLFGLEAEAPSPGECLNLDTVENWLTRLRTLLHVTVLNFHQGRLSREQQREIGFNSKRAYNRRFRCLCRLQRRIERMHKASQYIRSLQMAKTSGAVFITPELLRRDLPTACFVAYMVSRLGLRSQFTNKSQVRAFDTVAQMLLDHAKQSPTVCWEAIAYVHPEAEVLKRLSAEDRGRLFGVWTEELHRLADYLQDLWTRDGLDLETMIVRRGNDASSWNAAAGAWNKARDQWFSLLYSLGLEGVLEVYCPGKVMRLMARDLAKWHRMSGKGLDPATMVWSKLPRPWEVFKGQKECSGRTVQFVCDQYGVTSWVQPPPQKKAVTFTATPELVHGVTVSSPFLAGLLRRAGWFSGKEAHPVDVDVQVVRDEHGASIFADTLPKSV